MKWSDLFALIGLGSTLASLFVCLGVFYMTRDPFDAMPARANNSKSARRGSLVRSTKRMLLVITALLLTGCLQMPKPGEVWAIRNYDDPWCMRPRFLVQSVAEGSVRGLLYSGDSTPFVRTMPIRDFVGPFSSMKQDPHNCQPKQQPERTEP